MARLSLRHDANGGGVKLSNMTFIIFRQYVLLIHPSTLTIFYRHALRRAPSSSHAFKRPRHIGKEPLFHIPCPSSTLVAHILTKLGIKTHLRPRYLEEEVSTSYLSHLSHILHSYTFPPNFLEGIDDDLFD